MVAYVLEGSLTHTIEGREPVSFFGRAGHGAKTAKEIHWGRNTSRDNFPVPILSIQMTDKGEPPAVLVK